jgi:hypothetical protein
VVMKTSLSSLEDTPSSTLSRPLKVTSLDLLPHNNRRR